MALLCQRTLSAIESIEGERVPDNLLNNVATELSQLDDRRAVATYEDVYGENLSLSTATSIAEQLYRHRAMPDTLAVMLANNFGKSLSSIMVSAMSKNKKRARNEDNQEGAHARTSFRNVRNMWEEVETVHETALCLLHGALDKIGLFVPYEQGAKIAPKRVNRKFTAEKQWLGFTALDTMTNQPVRFASFCDPEEEALLGKVIDYNVENINDPNRWQYNMFTTRHSESVCDLFEDENVITVRRLRASVRAGLDSCIIAAFGAAAFRFIILEFGHNTELPKNITMHRQEKFSYRPEKMIALENCDELAIVSNPLQVRMIETIEKYGHIESGEELYRMLGYEMVKTPSRSKFFEEWSDLLEKCELIDKGVSIPRYARPTVGPDERMRYSGLYFGEPQEVVSVNQPRIILPYCPNPSMWVAQTDGRWEDNLGYITSGNVICEFADCI